MFWWFGYRYVCIELQNCSVLRTGVAFWRSPEELFLSREREETEMAQAIRAMQVTAMNGALAGTSQNIDTSVSLRTSNKVPNALLPTLSVRASLKDERDVLAIVAPATITSVIVLADAGAANALTAEDVTGTFLKVRKLLSGLSAVFSFLSELNNFLDLLCECPFGALASACSGYWGDGLAF